MSRPEKTEDWLIEAIALMVRDGCSLKQAAVELDLPVTSEQAATIARRSSFKKLLWEERHRYFAQLTSGPNFKKETLIGKLLDLADKLEHEGKSDKAADALFKAAKIAGFVGAETTVSVFGELSQKDLQAIRDSLGNKEEFKVIN